MEDEWRKGLYKNNIHVVELREADCSSLPMYLRLQLAAHNKAEGWVFVWAPCSSQMGFKKTGLWR
jgi:hypothetical protein